MSQVLSLPSTNQSSCSVPEFPVGGVFRAAMAGVVGGRVMVCGGREKHYSQACYTLVEGAWEPAPGLLHPRAYGASVVLPNGSLWISGGSLSYNTYYSSSEIFSPGGASWGPGPDLPNKIAFHCMVQYNNSHTFIAGGYNDAGSSSDAFFYHDGIFQPLPGMLSSRSHHMCSTYQGEIVVVGGWHGDHDYLLTVEIFNTVKNTWRAG